MSSAATLLYHYVRMTEIGKKNLNLDADQATLENKNNVVIVNRKPRVKTIAFIVTYSLDTCDKMKQYNY
eukprot:5508815-Ditylum_brightwellii.AAC.1